MSTSISATAYGQDVAQLLVPIVSATTVPGAFGSKWVVELQMYNNSAEPLAFLYPHFCFNVGECPPQVFIDPGHVLDPLTNVIDAHNAVLAYVPVGREGDIEGALRVRDLSQQAASFGTEIPIVRSDRMFSKAFDLLNVPNTASFRLTLRVYDVGLATGSEVSTQLYSATTGSMLSEETLSLAFPAPQPPQAQFPAYAQKTISVASNDDRIRVRIIPMESGQRLWAFVTVTNNETQELTTITPN